MDGFEPPSGAYKAPAKPTQLHQHNNFINTSEGLLLATPHSTHNFLTRRKSCLKLFIVLIVTLPYQKVKLRIKISFVVILAVHPITTKVLEGMENLIFVFTVVRKSKQENIVL